MPSTRQATIAGRPAEVAYHVPTPTILLLGCTPFGARRLGPITGRPLRDDGPCPTCGDRVSDRPDLTGRERPTVVYCARCDRMDDRHSPNLGRQRAEADVSARATDDADRRDLDAQHVRDGLKGVTLSEASRRRIWMGHKKGNPFAPVEPQCLAGVGRRWLEEIGQVPDWSLILDSRGKVIGHYRPDAGPIFPEG